jgi:hypothetical protein
MIFGWLTPFLNFAAFLLLLLVTLSVPIIKDIYLFRLAANYSNSFVSSASATGNVKFGIWGYCTQGIKGSAFGITKSVANECSPKKLGYSIDGRVSELLGVDRFVNITSKALTAVLVLHPIACGLAFIALILSFIMARPTSGTTRFSSLMTLLASLLAAVLTTAIFVIDVVLVAVVRHHVRDQSDNNVTAKYGNGVWMVLGAMIALWLAIITATCGIFQILRNRRNVDGARY